MNDTAQQMFRDADKIQHRPLTDAQWADSVEFYQQVKVKTDALNDLINLLRRFARSSRRARTRRKVRCATSCKGRWNCSGAAMNPNDGGLALKVGDVIATDARFGTNVDLCTITKVTRTMYITDGYRFRHDLQVVSPDRFGPWSGRIPTEKDWMRARIMAARDGLRKFEVTEKNVGAVETMLRGWENGA